jgi:hypothetical protein
VRTVAAHPERGRHKPALQWLVHPLFLFEPSFLKARIDGKQRQLFFGIGKGD